MYDALRRKFQCATVQLDFQLPIRFNLEYATESGLERPVIVHRAVLGSVERMFAILTEHYAGKWPLWLSPRQVMVVPISESSYGYAHEVRRRWGVKARSPLEHGVQGGCRQLPITSSGVAVNASSLHIVGVGITWFCLGYLAACACDGSCLTQWPGALARAARCVPRCARRASMWTRT